MSNYVIIILFIVWIRVEHPMYEEGWPQIIIMIIAMVWGLILDFKKLNA